MSYHHKGAFSGINPTNLEDGIDVGNKYIIIRYSIVRVNLILYETGWKRSSVMLHNSNFYCADDIIDIIADRIPADILQSRDTQVLVWVWSTIVELFDSILNHLDSFKSNLLGGKRANN